MENNFKLFTPFFEDNFRMKLFSVKKVTVVDDNGVTKIKWKLIFMCHFVTMKQRVEIRIFLSANKCLFSGWQRRSDGTRWSFNRNRVVGIWMRESDSSGCVRSCCRISWLDTRKNWRLKKVRAPARENEITM